MTKRVFLLSVFLPTAMWLAGCSTPINPARKVAIQRAGVVSVIGPDFHGTFVGTTVFGNREYKVETPEFVVDQVVENEMQRQLKGAFPSVVVLSANARQKFTQPVKPAAFMSPEVFSNPRSPAAAAAAREVAARENVDTIVVIFPLFVKNDYMPLPHRGVGVEGVNKFGLKHFYTYTHVRLAVYDGPTGTLLAEVRALYRPNLKTGLQWKDAFSQFTAEERETLRTAIHAQLREAVASSLKDAGLVN